VLPTGFGFKGDGISVAGLGCFGESDMNIPLAAPLLSVVVFGLVCVSVSTLSMAGGFDVVAPAHTEEPGLNSANASNVPRSVGHGDSVYSAGSADDVVDAMPPSSGISGVEGRLIKTGAERRHRVIKDERFGALMLFLHMLQGQQ